MRSCIYCGRELEKGELCNCPRSVARRAARQNAQDDAKTEKTQKNSGESERTAYKTGYTGHQSRFERARERRRAKKSGGAADKQYTKSTLSFIKAFIKSPVDKIINPPHIPRLAMLVIAAAEGAVAWLAMFFLCTGIRGSVFGVLGRLLGFGGIEGYSALAKMLMCALAGGVAGIVLFFLYTGIFWLINRFVFKSETAYWDFSTRLSLIGIPFTVLGAFGVALSVFSLRTLMLLLACGLISAVVLLYEALRTEWINRTPGSVMYAMLAGLFVLFTLLCNLIRL